MALATVLGIGWTEPTLTRCGEQHTRANYTRVHNAHDGVNVLQQAARLTTSITGNTPNVTVATMIVGPVSVAYCFRNPVRMCEVGEQPELV